MRLFLVLCLCSTILSHSPTFRMPEPGAGVAAVQNRYIVKLKGHKSRAKVSAFVKSQAAKVSQATLASISSSQGASASDVSYGVASVYNSTFMDAMNLVLSADDVKELKEAHGEDIEYIEPDQLAYAEGVQQSVPSWGMARVGQWSSNYGTQFTYPDAAGEGVDVYVLDTGLTLSPSFQNRAKFVRNFVPGSSNADVVGHGTHVAGTIGSSLYGVAKKARIYGVKVLGDNGNGAYSGIIAGIQYVTSMARPGKTIINMSLAGGASQAMNQAVAAARKAGVLVIAAAGNERQPACNVSPASSPDSLTVGATDKYDNTASFSNYGDCVDVFGPGVDIISLSTQGNDGYRSMSGTSMAAPHVAGVAALYMSMKSYNDADGVVRDLLGWSNRCVKGAAQGSGTGLIYANPRLQ